MTQKTVVSYEVLEDSGETGKEGFAALRRVRMAPIFDDGSKAEAHNLSILMRLGIDAVAVLPYCPRPEPLDTLVALRAGQRAAVWLRRAMELAIPEPEAPARLWEAVAGIREWEDHGPEGLVRRAVIELEEEIGLVVDAREVRPLGPAFFPSPGMYPEKIFLYQVEVSEARLNAASAVGDGSASEAGASVRVVTLREALAAIAGGEFCDGKTEIALRRLLAEARGE